MTAQQLCSPRSLHPLSLSLCPPLPLALLCQGIAADGLVPFDVSGGQRLNSAPARLTDSDSRRYYCANSLR